MRVRPEPIVANARFIVKCDCGFAHDSAATSGAEAVAEFLERHRCAETKFVSEVVDYTDNPMFVGPFAHADRAVKGVVQP